MGPNHEEDVRPAGAPPHTDPDADRTTPHAPAAPLADAPAEGRSPGLIAGRYEVGAVIARGGMGAVHAAVDRMFGREVAVKLVREEYVGSAVASRFFVEARIMGRLQHPGVPPVHEVGALPDGRPFLVMKLIKGNTLAELLRRREAPGGDLEPFLSIFEQVCLAVAFAHARGVVHRDLKPDNVMVGAFGEVQVMDWGLAKATSDPAPGPEAAHEGVAQETPSATRHGTVLGTLAYMAPEQARGETDRVDARSDVFGLGAILCVILTGQPPHTGKDAGAVLRRAAAGDLFEAQERVERSPGPRLVNLLAKRCLAARPEDRPAHAGEVAASLRSVLNFLAKSLRRSEVEDATARADEGRRAAGRRARTFTLAGVAGLLVGGTAAALGLWSAANREAAGRDAVERVDRSRKAAYQELFPVALDGLARDVSAGTFKPGWDRDGRERSARRVSMLLGALDPPDRARGHLAIAAAAADTRDEALADLHWKEAARQYQAVAPEETEAELACAAVKWEFPAPLRRAVLRQARDRLQRAAHDGKTTEPVRQRAAAALADVEAGLQDK